MRKLRLTNKRLAVGFLALTLVAAGASGLLMIRHRPLERAPAAATIHVERFREGKVDANNYTIPLNMVDVRKVVLKRAEHLRPGPFQVRFSGNKWRSPTTLGPMMHRFGRMLAIAKPRQSILIRDVSGGTVLAVRDVLISVPKPPSEATSRIKAIWIEVYIRWPGVRNMGVYNCRHIAGSYSWSYHAWAQAWDIGASYTVMNRVAHWLASHPGQYGILHVLWWYHNLLTGSSVDDHTTHVHVDVLPNRAGQRPPCA